MSADFHNCRASRSINEYMARLLVRALALWLALVCVAVGVCAWGMR